MGMRMGGDGKAKGALLLCLRWRYRSSDVSGCEHTAAGELLCGCNFKGCTDLQINFKGNKLGVLLHLDTDGQSHRAGTDTCAALPVQAWRFSADTPGRQQAGGARGHLVLHGPRDLPPGDV